MSWHSLMVLLVAGGGSSCSWREQSGQLGMTAWRFLSNLDNTLRDLLGLFLFLLLILDLSLLVEDLLGLPVADQEDHGGEDEDDGAPGGSVAETKNVGAVSA